MKNSITTKQSIATMTSIELVEIINSMREEGSAEIRHDNFMAKIEKHPGIQSPKFLGQYKDARGRMQKCYNLPRRESELMIMSESLEVQTKVYDRMTELEQGAAPLSSAKPSERLKFDMSLKLARVAMVELNMAPSGRLMLLKQVETKFDLPATLPNYAEDNNGSANGSMEATSLTELLHEFASTLSARKANDVLLGLGFLKEASRPSTKTPNKVTKFKVIDGDGLKFGKNMTSTSNPRETQPLWYRDTFSELLTLIVDNAKTAA